MTAERDQIGGKKNDAKRVQTEKNWRRRTDPISKSIIFETRNIITNMIDIHRVSADYAITDYYLLFLYKSFLNLLTYIDCLNNIFR